MGKAMVVVVVVTTFKISLVFYVPDFIITMALTTVLQLQSFVLREKADIDHQDS